MPTLSKHEADAHDRIMDAAIHLSDLLVSQHIDMDEYDLEELTVFLAKNSPAIKKILKKCTRSW